MDHVGVKIGSQGRSFTFTKADDAIAWLSACSELERVIKMFSDKLSTTRSLLVERRDGDALAHPVAPSRDSNPCFLLL